MAILAALRKSERYVIRIAGSLKIGQVAANASRKRAFVLASGMTGIAVQGGVHSGKGESRTGVIESHTLPVINGVAVLARGRKSCGYMVRRSRLLECSLMARVALNRQSLKLAHGS